MVRPALCFLSFSFVNWRKVWYGRDFKAIKAEDKSYPQLSFVEEVGRVSVDTCAVDKPAKVGGSLVLVVTRIVFLTISVWKGGLPVTALSD